MDAMDESIRFGIDYDAEKEAASLQADLDRGDRYENECKKMEEEWSKLEEAQRRMFGGEVGDEVSLCEPMLRVIISLFGDVDYTDP